MLNFNIKTIPHADQRYPTVGDYFQKNGMVFFRISEMLDERYEWFVLIHELTEYFLCKIAKISLQDIDAFDTRFIKSPCPFHSEPGDCPDAPYFHQHQAATMVEHICAILFGVSWKDYEEEVTKLYGRGNK